MKHVAISVSKRRAVNVSLEEQTVADARELGINLSKVCQTALAAEVKRERERRWIEDNWDAIQSSNAWVEKHGLPLEKYRLF